MERKGFEAWRAMEDYEIMTKGDDVWKALLSTTTAAKV